LQRYINKIKSKANHNNKRSGKKNDKKKSPRVEAKWVAVAVDGEWNVCGRWGVGGRRCLHTAHVCINEWQINARAHRTTTSKSKRRRETEAAAEE